MKVDSMHYRRWSQLICTIISLLLLLSILSFGILICGAYALDGPSSNEKTTRSAVQDGDTVTIVDCIGRNVTLPRHVERVVSLYADATRMVVSLGTGDKIVGVDSYSLKCPILKKVYPQLQNTTDVGSHISGTLSMEALAKLDPDVIFLHGSMAELADKIQSELGIPTVCVYFHVKEVQDFLSAYDVLGEVMGRTERATEIKDFISAEIDAIVTVSQGIVESDRPRVIISGVPLDSDPFRVATVSAAVEWAGGINLAADEYKGGSPSKTVTIEQIASWDPDIILINGLSLIQVQTIKEDPTWKSLRAVKEDRVYKIYSGMVGYDPAIFVIQPLNLARIMHPDLYKFDLEEKANSVFEKIYGVGGLHSVFVAENGISEV